MRTSSVSNGIALIVAMCVAASDVRAQEAGLERGAKVVARSPDFVLRDGANVIPVASPYEIYRVERVEGDRVRLYSGGREGDALASDVIRLDQAEAYFGEQIQARPRMAFGYLMRAAVRSFRDDLVNARIDCDEAVRLEPKNPWAYLVRGEISAGQDNLKDALVDLDKAIGLNNKIAAAYVARADCHRLAKDFDKALADVNQALSLEPNDVEALDLRSRLFSGRGDTEKALADLNRCVQLAPRDVEAWVARAFVHAQRGELDMALSDVDVALKLDANHDRALELRAAILGAKHTKARPYADPAHAITPAEGGVSLGAEISKKVPVMAGVKDASNAEEVALRAANDAVKHHPASAAAIMNRVLRYITRREYNKALADLDKALSLDPTEPNVYLNRSGLYSMQNDFKRARAELDAALARGIGGYAIFIARSRLSKSQGNLDDALVDADRAVKLGPLEPQCFIVRGQIRVSRHEYDLAISDFAAAIRLDPNSALGCAKRGEAWALKQEFIKALDDYGRAVSLAPDDTAIRLERERIISYLGNTEPDAVYFIINKPPLDAVALCLRGLTRKRRHQYDAAVADFSEAIRLDPKETFALYERGVVLYEMDEHAKALVDFDQVIRRAPESPNTAGAYRTRAWIQSSTHDESVRDGRLAVESALKACELTAWKDADCLIALANAQNVNLDFRAALTAIDKAVALIKPGDKRMRTCRDMREHFQMNLQGGLSAGKSSAP